MKLTLMRYFLLILVLFSGRLQAQEKPKEIYNITADAESEIKNAVLRAEKEGKHVLLMLGGNWCRWCRMYDKFRLENAKIDSASQTNFIFLHVNYSKENKNPAVMEMLDFPQRFGFPVFVVLDGKGNRLHTQNSAYLEAGEGYSEEKVLEFYSQWAPAALDPVKYR